MSNLVKAHTLSVRSRCSEASRLREIARLPDHSYRIIFIFEPVFEAESLAKIREVSYDCSVDE